MTSDPLDVAAALERARALQREHGAAAAERELGRFVAALEQGPNRVLSDDAARVRARLGQLRVRVGDLSGALRVLYDALTWADDGYAALHLGSTLTLRGAFEEAEGHLERARNRARADRDGPLAIGAWCALGELRLLQARGGEAVEAFGKALGITEFAPGDGPSVGPLAGLADAHRAWRNPRKAPELAARALERAERVGDLALRARAGLAVGAATADAELLDAASTWAEAAPHHPLWVRLRVARLALRDDPAERERVRAAAAEAGMAPSEARLGALASDRG